MSASKRVAALREGLEERGLETTGLKATLVARLSEAIARAPKRFARAACAETNETKRLHSAIDGMADEWICPITQELPLDPVMAEDGRYYQRSAIERWFGTVTGAAVNSPVTTLPMGRVLKAGPQVRSTIKKLVETDMISGAKADAWRKQIEKEAMVGRIRQRCKHGDWNAMVALGEMYRGGTHGHEEDAVQAFGWLKQAADLEDPGALCNVGQMYCSGYGVKKNEQRGVLCLGKAAVLGDVYACYVIAFYHRYGRHGFNTDAKEIAYLYKQMAKFWFTNVSESNREKVAEWLRSNPVQLLS